MKILTNKYVWIGAAVVGVAVLVEDNEAGIGKIMLAAAIGGGVAFLIYKTTASA